MSKKVILELILSILPCSILFSQIQIDWQQAYGSYSYEEAMGIAEVDDGFLILGYYGDDQPPTGMMSCGYDKGAWLIKINRAGTIVWQKCYDICPNEFFQVKNTTGESEYYIVGGRICYGAYNIKVIKIDHNGDEAWDRCVGNENGHPYDSRGVPVSDGGVVASAPYFCAGGDVTNYWGGVSDGWLVKFDNDGYLQWDLSLGTEGDEYIEVITQSSNGNLLIGLYSVEFGSNGNVGCDPYRQYPAILSSIKPSGEIEWNECYGGSLIGSAFSQIVELDDGYLLAGITTSEDGDLEGAGYHYGTYNGYPNGQRLPDIWLLRLDSERNIVWSQCYGGTDYDCPKKAFQTEDGGFIVFGFTKSVDCDVTSASHINLQSPNEGVAWIFRIDANGLLLWERCIGAEQSGVTRVADVIKHNDREYTIAGQMFCPSYEGVSGDINCSNCRQLYNPEFPHNSWNYWVAHITDTVDYSTLQVPEQHRPEDADVEVYPNPANNTVCVFLPIEAEDAQLFLFNMNGKKVAQKHFKGRSGWIETKDLPSGLYVLKIQTEERCFVRKVLKE